MEDLFFIATAVLAVGLIAGLTHLVARSLSRASAERAAFGQIDDHRQPLVRPGFILCLLGVFVITPLAFQLLSWWPPQWMERRARRQAVVSRVEAVGGWERLSADLAAHLATNKTPGPWILGTSTNLGLPSSLAALKVPIIEPRPFPTTNSALLHFYTGRRHRASYSILVSTGGTNAAPKAEQLRSQWLRSAVVRRITNGIYEVY